MGDLTNQQIDQTYDGLIHTATDQPITGTLVNLQDGLGNNLPMQVSNTTVNFTGTVTGTPNDNTTYDLTAFENNPDAEIRLSGSDATVDSVVLQAGTNVNMDTVGNTITINSTYTDTNTTYDFGAAGAAGNINLALTGSDATNDVVSIVAGSNITLTDNGANTFTIDAAGGGGASKSIVITTGAKNAWAGPPGQDVIVAQALIPANTITGPATIEFRSPVTEGSEGQWIYTSFQINSVPGAFDQINLLGRQTVSGGPDPHQWYRSITVDANGVAYYKDHNDFNFPGGGGDPIAEITNIDWGVDNYFTVTCWADASNATFIVYSPSLTITNA